MIASLGQEGSTTTLTLTLWGSTILQAQLQAWKYVSILPLPAQSSEALWTLTEPSAQVAQGPIWRTDADGEGLNGLPIDPAANRGFGLHTVSIHEHNGHNPAESDGYTNSFFFPGQYYDYRWPMILAGHDTINTEAADPRAGMPDGNGGIINIRGDWRETMSSHWFHDHMLDFTAQNVYKGIAAMFNYYSALDRGNEGLDDGVNLRLPSGTSLDWGNRDYDINLMIADKAWDQAGQLGSTRSTLMVLSGTTF